MTNRIIDLSDSPARLCVKYYQLVIEREYGDLVSLPLADLAVLIVAHAQVRLTHAVLAGLASAGGVFITCDDKSLPVGMLLPLDAHYHQVSRFASQARASTPTNKRLWRQLVRAKIAAQAPRLAALGRPSVGLAAMVSRVRSGDPDNVEAQAARRYWPAVFANRHFRRNRDAEDQNQLLNYGYAVLRAVVARRLRRGFAPRFGVAPPRSRGRLPARRRSDGAVAPASGPASRRACRTARTAARAHAKRQARHNHCVIGAPCVSEGTSDAV